MRTPVEQPSAEFATELSHDRGCIARFVPMARAVAVALSFATSAALFADAAADAAPMAEASDSLGSLGKSYAPRQVPAKIDPVEALLGRKYRGQGFTIDPHTLPGTFVVKFADAAKARFIADAGDGSPGLVSLSGWDLGKANSLLQLFNAGGRQWLSRSESDLAEIESRARENSGRMQPDLAGMIRVSGVPTDRLIEAARAFSDMSEVEFVAFEQHSANLQQGCDPNNAADCERPAPSCDNPFPGTDDINRTDCNPPASDPRIWGCNDVVCCDLVGDFDPTCADEQDDNGWDVWCAAWANLLCAGTIYQQKPDDGPYDPCFFDPFDGPDRFILPVFEPIFEEVQNASCLVSHSGRGCKQAACCNAICALDPTCCSDGWDTACANIALSGQISACTIPPDTSSGQSPDLTVQETTQGLQGYAYYTQGGPRPAQLEDLQGLGDTWAGAIAGGPTGFSGHGLALKEMDDFQNLIWENYQGGDPANNPFLRGGTIRVGIVESSAYTLHEDFILAGPAKNPTRPWEGPLLGEPKITIEPGQSPIYVEQGPISANHGTNVAGVILAADNGVGITGIAHDSSGILYPTFSVSGGFRGQDAIASALVDLRPGDVMTLAWGFLGGVPYFTDRLVGPAPVNPASSNIAYSTLIGVGTAAGVTTVAAAGLGAVPIQGASDVDQGVVIVTAIYPGNMLTNTAPPTPAVSGYTICSADIDEETLATLRFPYSNYQPATTQATDEQASASGWGFAVATTGATTRFDNTTVTNPELFLFQGVNDAPPTDIAPNLQIDRLRLYTQEFGGTSAATAMIAGVVARIQASAKQYFGSPLTPAQVRTVLGNHPGAFGQCPCSTGFGVDLPFREPGAADSCRPPVCPPFACIPEDCACEVHGVGPFPNLKQLPATVLNGGASDGNDVDVEVITGGRLIGYSWSSFQIRAADGNLLQINAERANAGTVRRGLAYLSTGLTTDIRVTRFVDLPNPAAELNGLAIRMVSQSSRNFVMAGVFVRNFETNRYEYIGAQFLTTAGVDAQFDIPDSGTFTRYINPETNEVDARIWTCGLGNTGRHVVRHDLVEIIFNPPFEPL